MINEDLSGSGKKIQMNTYRDWTSVMKEIVYRNSQIFGVFFFFFHLCSLIFQLMNESHIS